MAESGNYPPGAENDPRAPWNQAEPDECFDCNGSGYVDAETGDAAEKDDENAIECSTCEGEGYVDPPTREEIAEVRAEREFDALHEEGRI